MLKLAHTYIHQDMQIDNVHPVAVPQHNLIHFRAASATLRRRSQIFPVRFGLAKATSDDLWPRFSLADPRSRSKTPGVSWTRPLPLRKPTLGLSGFSGVKRCLS